MPRQYQAEMKILVNRDRVDSVVTPDPNAAVAVTPLPAVSEEDLNSEVELLKSRDLLEKVVLACGLESPKSRHSRWIARIDDTLHGKRTTADERLARTVQDFQSRLIVEPLKKTDLIRVAYASRDPRLSARVLQTLAALYQEKHAAVHRPTGTFGFFDQQAANYRGRLAAAEEKLTDFDAQEGVVAPEAQKELMLQQLSQFQAQIQQDRTSAAADTARIRALEASESASPERQTTQMRKIGNAQLLAELGSMLASLEVKRTDLLTKYEPAYPAVQDVETQIVEVRKAIAEAEQSPVADVTTDRVPARDWMATELAKTEADRAQVEAQAAGTARVVRQYETAAQQLDRNSVTQDDLTRDVKVAEDSYLLYLRKREEARISDALDSKRIVNVSIAERPTVPALPTVHFGWILIGGFFLAGVTGVGAAYAADRLDPSFRTPEELGRYLEVEVLASIPASTPRQ